MPKRDLFDKIREIVIGKLKNEIRSAVSLKKEMHDAVKNDPDACGICSAKCERKSDTFCFSFSFRDSHEEK